MKRQKTVFPTDQIAHIWAHAIQKEARNPGGNFSVRGPFLYSYRTVIAVRLTLGEPDAPRHTYVLASRRCSNTTAKQLGLARRAIPHGARVVFLNNVEQLAARWPVSNITGDFLEFPAGNRKWQKIAADQAADDYRAALEKVKPRTQYAGLSAAKAGAQRAIDAIFALAMPRDVERLELTNPQYINSAADAIAAYDKAGRLVLLGDAERLDQEAERAAGEIPRLLGLEDKRPAVAGMTRAAEYLRRAAYKYGKAKAPGKARRAIKAAEKFEKQAADLIPDTGRADFLELWDRCRAALLEWRDNIANRAPGEKPHDYRIRPWSASRFTGDGHVYGLLTYCGADTGRKKDIGFFEKITIAERQAAEIDARAILKLDEKAQRRRAYQVATETASLPQCAIAEHCKRAAAVLSGNYSAGEKLNAAESLTHAVAVEERHARNAATAGKKYQARVYNLLRDVALSRLDVEIYGRAVQLVQDAEKIRAAERAAAIEKWRAGGDRFQNMQQDAPRLRLSANRENVETSHGAVVPVSVCPGLWALVQHARKTGKDISGDFGDAAIVGHFRLSTVRADGGLVVGCHDIPAAEIDGIAAALGYTGGEG